MHSGRHAKQPCSMAWQSEHTLICSDDHIITHAPLRFTHTGIPCASSYCTSPIQSTPHTSASPIYGVCHTGVNLPGGPSYSVTATPPMTSREAIPSLTSFVGNREHSQLT